jgi:transcriptional repressor NrdR
MIGAMIRLRAAAWKRAHSRPQRRSRSGASACTRAFPLFPLRRANPLLYFHQRRTQYVVVGSPTHLTMRCPKCGNLEDKVIDSRAAKAGAAIRRRRECLACQHRFTTYEEIERRDLRVIKRDGRHEPFDRQKLLSGMIKACEKRPVGYDALERAVEEIIQELEQAYDHEVPTNAIGIRVMERLHSMDEVAYIRYASVYRQFQDIGEFINEIESLGRKIKRNALQPDLFVP